MGETRETIRLTMTVDEAKYLADFLSRNKRGEFEVDSEFSDDEEASRFCLTRLRVGDTEKLGIKLQMAILRSQL